MHAVDSEQSGSKIAVINGLRGLAIVGVVWHHLYGALIDRSAYVFFIGPVKIFGAFLLANASQAVPLFFVLSGFVLALPYFQGRREMHSFSDAMSFYRRRLRRLGPLYLVSVLISLSFIYPRRLIVGVPLMLTMTFTFTNKYFFPPSNIVLWSLGVEAMFCILLPLILILVRRFGMKRVWIFTLIGCAAVRMFSTRYFWYEAVANGIPGRLDDFVCGMMAAWLFVERKNSKPIPFGLLLAGIIFFIELQLTDYCAELLRSDVVGLTPRVYIYPLLYTCINCSFLLTIDALLRGRHLLLTWILETKWLQLIGLMSYSIYVWHLSMIHSLNARLDHVHELRFLVMLFLLSFASYRYIEFGSVRDIRKLLPSPRTVKFPLVLGLRKNKQTV